MVRSKKRILSYSERMTLEDQKRDAESALREAKDPSRSRQMDQAAIQKEIQHLDKALHDGQAPRLSGVKKDALAKEAKELASKLKEGMPTKAEMMYPARHPGAITKHIKWDKRNAERVARFKEIQRSLNPDAPVNIESLRRAK